MVDKKIPAPGKNKPKPKPTPKPLPKPKGSQSVMAASYKNVMAAPYRTEKRTAKTGRGR